MWANLVSGGSGFAARVTANWRPCAFQRLLAGCLQPRSARNNFGQHTPYNGIPLRSCRAARQKACGSHLVTTRSTLVAKSSPLARRLRRRVSGQTVKRSRFKKPQNFAPAGGSGGEGKGGKEHGVRLKTKEIFLCVWPWVPGERLDWLWSLAPSHLKENLPHTKASVLDAAI
jgi:hypothetical protein